MAAASEGCQRRAHCSPFWLTLSRMHGSLCRLMSAAGLPAGLEGVIEESMAAPEGGFALMVGRHTEEKVLAGYW